MMAAEYKSLEILKRRVAICYEALFGVYRAEGDASIMASQGLL